MKSLNFSKSCIFFLILVLTIVLSGAELCAKIGRHLLQHQCVLSPEGTEGPYYISDQLVRRNIRENKNGVALRLRLTLTDATRCEPLANVSVDLWHADALGYYSGYVKYDPNLGAPTTRHVTPSDNSTFLRGVQFTDAEGVVEFDTIYPGFYGGRTNHIHLTTYMGGDRIYTGQLYFPEYINYRIFASKPYSLRSVPRVKTHDDWLFKKYRGVESIMPIKTRRGNDIRTGLKAEMVIGINPNKNKTDL